MKTAPTQTATLLIESHSGFEPVALKSVVTIGRDRKCDVVIDHPTASRMHARLWKDGSGWHYQDMGSANGTKFGDAKLQSIIDLSDGTALRIGRVQAYFFSGAVPESWTPPEHVGQNGKLLRCRCGHIGFAPQYTRGMTLKCVKCGRDLVHNDTPEPMTAPRIAVDCAACHTTIEPSERMYVCEECGAQMHHTCHVELDGCATYGCSKVKHDHPHDHSDDAAPTESAMDSHDDGFTAPSTATTNTNESNDSVRYRLAQCGLVVLVGIPTFGIPAIAFAAHRLVSLNPKMGRMRFVYAAIAFVGGGIGFIASAYWWLGGPTPWRLL